MRIEFKDNRKLTPVRKLEGGDVFTEGIEYGVYIKVAGKPLFSYEDEYVVIGINLVNGHYKTFRYDTMVELLNCKMVCTEENC